VTDRQVLEIITGHEKRGLETGSYGDRQLYDTMRGDVVYNSSLVKISLEYFLVEVLCSKVRNNAEVYPDIHKKTDFLKN
jgi:hypothetical protein